MQFGHEALAETHDFVIALAFGIEVRSAFAAAHGQRGQRVLEYLFKCQELQNSQRHRRMEAQATLVRADRAIHLDAEAAIDLDLSLIIEPRNAEHDDSLGLDDALKNAGLAIFGMTLQHQS